MWVITKKMLNKNHFILQKTPFLKPQEYFGRNRRNSVHISEENRCYNIDRIVIGHILVNSIRNKFEMLSNIVKNKIDTLMLSKIIPSYLTGIHSIQGLVATARHGVTRKKEKQESCLERTHR